MVVLGLRRGADRVAADRAALPDLPAWNPGSARSSDESVLVSQSWEEIRRFMWNYVGIVRSDRRLRQAQERLALVSREVSDAYWRFLLTRDLIEVRIGGDGTYSLDYDGASSWGWHSMNCTPSGMQGAIWVMFTQTLICNDKVNDGAVVAVRDDPEVLRVGHILDEDECVVGVPVGDRVGLHPVWIMFALLAGGSLFGFVGVLIAVPVAAVIGVIARYLIGRYRDSAIYRGIHPG
mgnify:CR=1 FL=1